MRSSKGRLLACCSQLALVRKPSALLLQVALFPPNLLLDSSDGLSELLFIGLSIFRPGLFRAAFALLYWTCVVLLEF